jgi:hypothetical protein
VRRSRARSRRVSGPTSERIREAIAAGINGPILQVEDDGGGVRISIE